MDEKDHSLCNRCCDISCTQSLEDRLGAFLLVVVVYRVLELHWVGYQLVLMVLKEEAVVELVGLYTADAMGHALFAVAARKIHEKVEVHIRIPHHSPIDQIHHLSSAELGIDQV
jgi:hypothetical protein